MSERLPYENYLQQEWNDLPLPDENMAWADMKRRLEEDDDDGIIVWWRRGCLGWGLLLLTLIVTGWWLFNYTNLFRDRTGGQEQSQQATKGPSVEGDSRKREKINSTLTNRDIVIADSLRSVESFKSTDTSTTVTTGESIVRYKEADQSIVRKSKDLRKTTDPKGKDNNKGSTGSPKRPDRSKEQSQPVNSKAGDSPSRKDDPNQQQPAIPRDTVIRRSDSPVDTLITSRKPTVDTTKAEDTVKRKPEDKTEKKKKKNTSFFSAGAAIHEQLPIAGQENVPFNAFGRKGTLLDHIPSLYIRYNRTNKWFIESEFRYGAPQYSKELLYNQKLDVDPFGRPVITSRRLQKTYYHQIPISFNYHLLPGLTVGTGIVFNKFASAIIDEDVIVQTGTGDSLVSNSILRVKKETELASNFLQAQFQLQYQWRKFTLGGRYTFGLQPYITFTLPNATEAKERNRAFSLFLRYEFWRSKEK